MTETDKKSFPLEKILTVSLNDYITGGFAEKDQGGRAYDLVGVHAEHSNLNEGTQFRLIDVFAKRIPAEAEVVVEYSVIAGRDRDRFYGIASGIALVPKNSNTTSKK